jgi:hypothetical protein
MGLSETKNRENSISVLVDQSGLTPIRSRSIDGFETSLDGIVLAHTLVVLGSEEQ